MASPEFLKTIEADPMGGDFTTAPEGLSAFEQAKQEALSSEGTLLFLTVVLVPLVLGALVHFSKRKHN